jgi:preprotein translocase subunit YajC
LNFLMILAQATTTTTQPAAAGKPGLTQFLESPLLPIALGIMVIMMFMGRGKRADEKARQEQLKQLKRGDRIQTIGGIQGTVVRVEEARIEIKVDESSNTKIWFVRNAIAKVVETAAAEK